MLERARRLARKWSGGCAVSRPTRACSGPSRRLGARTPIYGPLTSVVAAADASRWLEALIDDPHDTPELSASIVQIAALTGDPLRDIHDDLLERARRRLQNAGIGAEARPLHEVMTPTFADTSRAFGEPLPNGLRLVNDGRGKSATE